MNEILEQKLKELNINNKEYLEELGSTLETIIQLRLSDEKNELLMENRRLKNRIRLLKRALKGSINA